MLFLVPLLAISQPLYPVTNVSLFMHTDSGKGDLKWVNMPDNTLNGYTEFNIIISIDSGVIDKLRIPINQTSTTVTGMTPMIGRYYQVCIYAMNVTYVSIPRCPNLLIGVYQQYVIDTLNVNMLNRTAVKVDWSGAYKPYTVMFYGTNIETHTIIGYRTNSIVIGNLTTNGEYSFNLFATNRDSEEPLYNSTISLMQNGPKS